MSRFYCVVAHIAYLSVFNDGDIEWEVCQSQDSTFIFPLISKQRRKVEDQERRLEMNRLRLLSAPRGHLTASEQCQFLNLYSGPMISRMGKFLFLLLPKHVALSLICFLILMDSF